MCNTFIVFIAFDFFIFHQQQSARTSRYLLRTKTQLGGQFVASVGASIAKSKRCSPVTPEMSTTATKQWSGRRARKNLRDSKQIVGMDAATAISLFSPGVKGAYVNKRGCCFSGKWCDVGPRSATDIVNHMLDAMTYVAKSFCPHDPVGLVNAVLGHGHGAAGQKTTKDYDQWAKAELMQLLLTQYNTAKKRIRRKQILSWVAATSAKRWWIKRLFGVSYGVIRTAQRHALMWSPGGAEIRLSLRNKTYRPSARAAYLKRWINVNVECDPAGKNKLRRLRFLRRHSGHKLYELDSKRHVPTLKPYCRTHFYNHPLQSGLHDTKVHGGLCSICTRYGAMVFEKLKLHAIELHQLLKSIFPFDIDAWKKTFDVVRRYFVRGGMFQRSLKKSCNNKHCCMTFALSHPTKKEFQAKCDHEHDLSDPTCILRDKLWRDLHDYIADAIDSTKPAAITLLSSTSIVGEDSSTTMRKKLDNVSAHLDFLRKSHDKFVGHLMLDTMQSLKHFEMRDEVSQSHLLQHSDYMMKLRPLMKFETGSDFHMVMSKGDSVLVSGFSFVGTAEQMASIQAQEGDSMLHHVVTISGDTTQGGLEGYSALFSQLSAVHKFAPQAKTISVISDAGSGFKSTACPFGLMWASHLDLLPGGLKITSWMYPAAGEAKQPETDGAMPR